MKNNFELVLGIEVHAELKTRTKMFSSAPVSYGQDANTLIDDHNLGYPGTKPVVNFNAINLALRLAPLLGFEEKNINKLVIWDRKNYFYPDLPKGFQITQFRKPIAQNGKFKFLFEGKETFVTINEMHLEEDTAKQFHDEAITRLDYNRSGNPLIEIVTDHLTIKSGAMAKAYLTELQKVLFFYDISDAKMHEGSMRCDVNISIRPVGYQGFGTRVEIKNINSISNAALAIEKEFANQVATYLKGEEIIACTKRYDEIKKDTVLMRTKGGEDQYRYIAEANILPIDMSKRVKQFYSKFANSTKSQSLLNQLLTMTKLITDNGGITNPLVLERIFSKNYYKVFVWFLTYLRSQKVSFDSEYTKSLIASITNYIVNDGANLVKIVQQIVDEKIGIYEQWVYLTTPLKTLKPFWQNIVYLINSFNENKISSRHLKDATTVFEKELLTNFEKLETSFMKKTLAGEAFVLITNERQIESLIVKVVDELYSLDSKPFTDYATNPRNAEGKVLGALMKETNGNIDPKLASELVKKFLTTKYS